MRPNTKLQHKIPLEDLKFQKRSETRDLDHDKKINPLLLEDNEDAILDKDPNDYKPSGF